MIVEGVDALVTGGASGLGAAVVSLLSERGARVTSFDKSGGTPSMPAHILALKVDVMRSEEIERAFDVIARERGLPRIIVNCAGYGEFAPIVSSAGPMSRAHFDRMMDVNLGGTLDVVRIGAFRMLTLEPIGDERGVIMNTSSIAAWDGIAAEVAYSAAKAAIVGMTLPLARDLAPYGIRVNTIAPGVFRTSLVKDLPADIEAELMAQTPFPVRMGDAKEFASLALHLIENQMMNGETIRIDAGLRMGFARQVSPALSLASNFSSPAAK